MVVDTVLVAPEQLGRVITNKEKDPQDSKLVDISEKHAYCENVARYACMALILETCQ